MCIANNIKAFTMKNHRSPSLISTAQSLALVVALFSASAAEAQCCNQGRHQRPGSFELSAGATQLALTESNLVPFHADLTYFSRSRGPIRSGIRLGIARLGSSSRDDSPSLPNSSENAANTQYRMLLPGMSGVLRLDPLRGGFRPFVEAEAGVDATFVDRRALNGAGERIGYDITTFQPALQYGWSAGVRVRLSRGAFLVMRYGNKHGGSLNIPLEEGPESQCESADGDRQTATVGLSFGL